MGLSIYKSGQGYWTRLMTAIAIATLTLGGAVWFNARVLPTLLDSGNTYLYWQAGIIAGTTLVVGALLWFLLNRPKIADFMIATENEMKKVNWPSKKSIIALTWVVIAGTLIIAIILLVADLGFRELFIDLNIIQQAKQVPDA